MLNQDPSLEGSTDLWCLSPTRCGETHLQPKFVEKEVDKVLGTAKQVPVQLLAGAVDADGLGGQRAQLVLPAVVLLAPVHNGLEHQQQQDLQVVLGRGPVGLL